MVEHYTVNVADTKQHAGCPNKTAPQTEDGSLAGPNQPESLRGRLAVKGSPARACSHVATGDCNSPENMGSGSEVKRDSVRAGWLAIRLF